MKKSLPHADQLALASFFLIWWGHLVLEPGNNRLIRGTLAKLGLIERHGPLKLTKRGERVLAVTKTNAR